MMLVWVWILDATYELYLKSKFHLAEVRFQIHHQFSGSAQMNLVQWAAIVGAQAELQDN